ncbi:exonuclease RecJ [Halohasta litorea]|uniref:Exonuclease RecJ n=1 Tax=Halohasta litorea TaxID=869891 RepID=A0ABD6D895_9EURY|nr:exonuclease RecJ [Halohasta litorea]
MSETHTQTVDPDAAATLATELATAPFVRVYGHADGDSLAAAGLLAVALRSRSVPFQIHVSDDPAGDLTDPDTEPVDDDSQTVLVTSGRRDVADHAMPPADDSRPASVVAAAVSRELGVDPDPLLALAGTIAAGSLPGTDGSGSLLEQAEQSGLVERRPGVAVPTADLADGVAHSTLLSGPFSGDTDAGEALLAELDLPAEPAEFDDEDHTRVASVVALETSTAETSTPKAADAVETVLRPYATPNGPFATLGGYADVLSALAAETPGLAISLALGAANVTDEALDTWRDHANAAHRALQEPITGRYEGVFVLRVETDRPAALPTVARLAQQFRSPEPVALVVTADPVDGQRHAAAAAAADDPQGLAESVASVATEFGGTAGGTPTQATCSVGGDVSDGDLIAAVREALE